jgi:MoaA/NifB/PqqE/SkfB family radical SAM enzyme
LMTRGMVDVSGFSRICNHDGAPVIKANRILPFTRPHFKIRVGPCGIHVFNRMTGLNFLLDEVRVAPALWANAPRQVSIALTNSCDLECSYCFSPKHPTSLDFEWVIDLLDELDANGCLGIGLGGGEPTLYPHLVELCQYATQHTGLAITLTTHAHRFNDGLAEALTGGVHFVRVSMDGIGDTYEALRGRPFAAFLRCLENVSSVAPFGINYVVNSRTLPDLDAATKLAAEVGAIEFLLLPEQPAHGNGGIDDRTAQALQQWVTQYQGSIPITVSQEGADGLPTCNPLEGESGLRAYAHIDASGTLKRSSFDGDGVPIGDGGLMRALNILSQKEVRP